MCEQSAECKLLSLLLRGGQGTGDEPDRPLTTKHVSSNSAIYINHPFVSCMIDGVQVRALVDTGAMKSFISTSIFNIIHIDQARVDKSRLHNYISITGVD
jgi:hypothetical protein